MKNISEVINQLGFEFASRHNVKGRISVADLFTKSKKRCGIYLLEFANGTYYVGQALDVVRRFNQHRKNHDHICGLWFQAVRNVDLNEVEQWIIQKAEKSNMPLTNRTFVQNVSGETDLDLVITKEVQEKWLSSKSPSRERSSLMYRTVDEKFIFKYRDNFQKLVKDEQYPIVKMILKTYITTCIPFWPKTELSFWSLSCLPATNKSTWPRYFCLNINAMEILVLGFEKRTGKPFLFVNLSDYFKRVSKKDVSSLKSKYNCSEFKPASYRAAAGSSYTVHFRNAEDFIRMLKNEPVMVRSMKELNLRLMRKGGTIYSPYHCFDLVNEVMKKPYVVGGIV